jgi:hypothetical protein
MLLEAVVDGKRALAVVFRGTNDYQDRLQWADVASHYALFDDVLERVKRYLSANPDIGQVWVTGHSLGGAPAQMFMSSVRSDPNAAKYIGATFGSPGAPVEQASDWGTDHRIVHFANTRDLAVKVGLLSNSANATKEELAAFQRTIEVFGDYQFEDDLKNLTADQQRDLLTVFANLDWLANGLAGPGESGLYDYEGRSVWLETPNLHSGPLTLAAAVGIVRWYNLKYPDVLGPIIRQYGVLNPAADVALAADLVKVYDAAVMHAGTYYATELKQLTSIAIDESIPASERVPFFNVTGGAPRSVESALLVIGDSGLDGVPTLNKPAYVIGTWSLDGKIVGGPNDDIVYGTGLFDSLHGTAGDGIDTLMGRRGNDTYYIDFAPGEPFDMVVERPNEGTDTVETTVNNYRLPDNVENLRLAKDSGVAWFDKNLNGIGNQLDNTIIGNDGNNTLAGGPGSDTITGGGDEDKFYFASPDDAGATGDVLVDFDPQLFSGDVILIYGPGFDLSLEDGKISADNLAFRGPLGNGKDDIDDYFIMERAIGKLFFDPDGIGPQPERLLATIPTDNSYNFDTHSIEITYTPLYT